MPWSVAVVFAQRESLRLDEEVCRYTKITQGDPKKEAWPKFLSRFHRILMNFQGSFTGRHKHTHTLTFSTE